MIEDSKDCKKSKKQLKKSKQYTGCIGNVELVRDFARGKFVYGLKMRDDYDFSPRTYDDKLRFIRDWFQECLKTQEDDGKQRKYISLDSRGYSQNPLYQMWKACTFTVDEIVFFFYVINYLYQNKEPVSKAKIYDYIYSKYPESFSNDAMGKWFKYKGCPTGIVIKEGRKYSLAPVYSLENINDLLFYYSEIAPVGVVGSFILDKTDTDVSPFSFKQHYVGQAFDSEVLCNVLYAIRKNKDITFDYLLKDETTIRIKAFPVKIHTSTQNGRQYIIAWERENNKTFVSYRLDRMKEISIDENVYSDVSVIRDKYETIRKHIWGVSMGEGKLSHIEFCIRVAENEAYIIKRLIREKRCGTVAPVEDCSGVFKFSADVYDAQEMFPWIRTFICRIVQLNISDKDIERYFWKSIEDMYKIYSIEGKHV